RGYFVMGQISLHRFDRIAGKSRVVPQAGNVLETMLRSYSTFAEGLLPRSDETPKKISDQGGKDQRDRYSGEAVFPNRGSRANLPVARLRVALLGDRVFPAQAGEEQYGTAHVPAKRRGKRPADQAPAIRRGLYHRRCEATTTFGSQGREEAGPASFPGGY